MNKPHLTTLTRHVDDRGDLAEIWRYSWELMGTGRGDDSPMGAAQVYTVFDPAAYTVRAYHRHQSLWDLFHIAHGSAKFHLVPGPSEFPLRGNLSKVTAANVGDHEIITLSARKPQLLVVPPLWWHGWVSLEPNTLLISIASHEYDPDNIDEERIPPNVFGDHVWKVTHK